MYFSSYYVTLPNSLSPAMPIYLRLLVLDSAGIVEVTSRLQDPYGTILSSATDIFENGKILRMLTNQ